MLFKLPPCGVRCDVISDFATFSCINGCFVILWFRSHIWWMLVSTAKCCWSTLRAIRGSVSCPKTLQHGDSWGWDLNHQPFHYEFAAQSTNWATVVYITSSWSKYTQAKPGWTVDVSQWRKRPLGARLKLLKGLESLSCTAMGRS